MWVNFGRCAAGRGSGLVGLELTGPSRRQTGPVHDFVLEEAHRVFEVVDVVRDEARRCRRRNGRRVPAHDMAKKTHSVSYFISTTNTRLRRATCTYSTSHMGGILTTTHESELVPWAPTAWQTPDYIAFGTGT